MNDLIDSISTKEEAIETLSHYEKLKMCMFQSSKSEIKKYEKGLSLIKDMNDARKLFLETAKFKLENISRNSKKYFIVG